MTFASKGLNWIWREFGNRLMLVTDGGGALVILAPSRNGRIETRDPETGTLRPLKADDAIAQMIAEAPTQIRRTWEALVSYGYPPPDMCGNDLPVAVEAALDCLVRTREAMLAELLPLREQQYWHPANLTPTDQRNVLLEWGSRPDVSVAHYSESAHLERPDMGGWLNGGGSWLANPRRWREIPVPPAESTSA